jgi:hypothetical protein
MTDYTALDIVLNASRQKPLEVERAVTALMADRIADLIATKRQELAQKIFNKESEIEAAEDEVADEEYEMEDEDFDEFVGDDDETETEETDDEDA